MQTDWQTVIIPREVADVLGEFRHSRRSGSVLLEIKEGDVQQIKATTTTSVSKVDKQKPIT